MKKNDVYRYFFNEESIKNGKASWHCFDGILICREIDGKCFLIDTYWSGGDNKYFTPDNVNDYGGIIFFCNLDDMEEVDNPYYYDDVVTLNIHGGYRTQYYIKKGTPKSANKMIETIEIEILELKSVIAINQEKIKYLKKNIDKIKSGDINVYL